LTLPWTRRDQYTIFHLRLGIPSCFSPSCSQDKIWRTVSSVT
jgi:hypothetical protein